MDGCHVITRFVETLPEEEAETRSRGVLGTCFDIAEETKETIHKVDMQVGTGAKAARDKKIDGLRDSIQAFTFLFEYSEFNH